MQRGLRDSPTHSSRMQAGTAHTERHDQVAGIVYRNICTEYGPDPPKSRDQTDIMAVPSDSTIKKEEYEKLEKYPGVKEELERTWKVKVKVVPVVIGARGAVTPKLEERLQQIPGTTSDLYVQKSAALGTAKILRRTTPE